MRSKIIKQFGLVLGPLLFTFTLLFFKPEGLSPEGVAVLATTIWVAIWWILEVVPIAVTAMLPIILFPITGAMELSTTTAAFGHKYVFLYIGGFVLAISWKRLRWSQGPQRTRGIEAARVAECKGSSLRCRCARPRRGRP